MCCNTLAAAYNGCGGEQKPAWAGSKLFMPGVGEDCVDVLGAAGEPLSGVQGRPVLVNVAVDSIAQDLAQAPASTQPGDRISQLLGMAKHCNTVIDSWRDLGHGLAAALPAVLINLPPEETQTTSL